eukprot:Protomagalhaensia_wolfi_Nauph_80__790@NODE_1457_length_1519_cov_433_272297_g1127_i0_p2_GENE_NODE_1457_length_1519_cov_433_272297_g1127_i0NODE_1457_length_1519_cov_433_272297_g1127_i0_p2_ORF_typecomplete_len178_score29_23Pribosyltran/PF00156_27/2_5e17Pribosyl_synth/PF14572_6/0_024UPRTase/PF14681_6/0_065GTP_EFTU_D2/PF03144_25/0_091_NODE_1457_length_1519_cov_433_272297_g1127_i070603
MLSEEDQAYIQQTIGLYPDFPKPGVLFRDFMPCLRDPRAFKLLVTELGERVAASGADILLVPEARGYLFGAPVALSLGLPLVCARKPGKLPGNLHREAYALEYGEAVLEVQQGSIKPGSKVYIMDDLLATGGTITALEKLVLTEGAEVAACGFIMELLGLNGRRNLQCQNLDTLFQV